MAFVRRVWAGMCRHWWVVVAAALALTVKASVAIAIWSPDLADVQRARLRDFADPTWGTDLGPWLALDVVFIAAYVSLGVALVMWRRPKADPLTPDVKPQRIFPTARAALYLLIGAAVADLAEDAFLRATLKHRSAPADLGDWLGAMRMAGLVKWGLVAAAVVALLTFFVERPWQPDPGTDSPDRAKATSQLSAGPGQPEVDTWAPPPAGKGPRVGISLSGGGIRSAAFSLGALQALHDRKKLEHASYITAASGGAYFAAGWAVSQADVVAMGEEAEGEVPWGQGSPEERWFRDHASYLIPDIRHGAMGLVRIVGGLVVNLVLVWFLLFAVARPVGWVIRAAHPELAAGTAYLTVDDVAEMEITLADIEELEPVLGPDQVPVRRFAFVLTPVVATDGTRPLTPGEVCFRGPPFDQPRVRSACTTIETRRPGIAEVTAGRVSIVRQPELCIVRAAKGCPGAADPADPAVAAALATLHLDESPIVKVADDVLLGPALLPADLEIESQPTVHSKSGLAALPYPTYDSWMWKLAAGPLAAGLVVALVVMVSRLQKGKNVVGRTVAIALAITGLAVFAVTIALPWLMIWMPRTLASFVGLAPKVSKQVSPTGSGIQDYLIPGGGFLALAGAAARTYLTPGTSPTADAKADAAKAKPGLVSRAWKAFTGQRTAMGWYGTSPARILLSIIAVVVPFALFLGLLQYPVGNGLDGKLMGFAFVRDLLPYGLWPAEWLKLVIVVVVLGVFWIAVDAHAWSLYPYYKFRLSSAFMLQRTEDRRRVEPRQGLSAIRFEDMCRPDTAGSPQVVLCCAVNLSEYGVVPPGRRAASFTFSSTEIGGPIVGYATPEQYTARLSDERNRDVAVPAAMAISGAAFSPAMGKFNLGPMGPVLALANLRLGVWIPHPTRVREGAADDGTYRNLWSRPSWRWYLHELRNKYPLHGKYVYVSDGGHWENLGLVELLRRGCTEIYCISGAGDRAVSFGTIGEAIALAREELGIEILLDPSALRAPVAKPEPAPTRELRRKGAEDIAAPFAAARTVTGTIRYPGRDELGTIHYVEADLTADLPFDVHTFAEAEPVFPDDSTADQVFNHRQFESYRRLGYHQTEAAVPDS